MIVPTIGRVVLIRNRPASPKSSQAEPALVCYVHNDRLINVGGFNAHGQHFGFSSVRLIQDDEEAPAGPYAEWMPYQKAVAAGTVPAVQHTPAPATSGATAGTPAP